MRIRAQCAIVGWLLAIAACHGDEQPQEPSSAESTEGGEDPVYDTPDGTVGAATGSAPATPADGMPPNEGLGPGTGGPPDIVGGGGGVAGVGGEGGTGGALK